MMSFFKPPLSELPALPEQNNGTQIGRTYKIYGLLLLAVIFSYLMLGLNILEKTPVLDWDYFNSLSFVVHNIFNHYHKFPLHDPWVLGGYDILSNPQSRVFSPFVLLDLLFVAPMANALSLLFLGFIGIIGCYKLLTYLKIQPVIATIGSVIYINASWFSLHYTLGHIIFGSFQLMALCFYFILKLSDKKYIFYFALLMAFFLLDGAIYTFIFSLYLLLFSLAIGINGINLINVWKFLWKNRTALLVSLLCFVLISSAKIVPLLSIHANRNPEAEFIQMPFTLLFVSLFNPFQTIAKEGFWVSYGSAFHEFGCYLGFAGVLIILWFLHKSQNLKANYKFLLIALLFLFIATGRAMAINPWRLMQIIPFLNQAHIQSRYFILFYIMFVILLSKALNHLFLTSNIKWIRLLLVFLVIESFFVANYSFYHAFNISGMYRMTNSFRQAMPKKTISKTICQSQKPEIYFKKDIATKTTYEPAKMDSRIKCADDLNYKGEVYVIDGSGNVEILSFNPGEIIVGYDVLNPSTFQINSNFLAGWKVKQGDAEVFSRDGLITVGPIGMSGTITLEYAPWYLKYVLIAYSLGIMLTVVVFLKQQKDAKKSG